MKKLTGVTKSGFTYSILEKNVRNYELVEALGELETNPLALPRVMNLLLGKEQAQKLIDKIVSLDVDNNSASLYLLDKEMGTRE